MSTLRGRTVESSFNELLKIRATGLTAELVDVEDGEGNPSPIKLSTTTVALNGLAWPTDGANPGKILAVQSSGVLSWIDALPSQTGNSGKYLKTDGTSAFWASVPASTGGGGAVAEPDSASYEYNPDGTVDAVTEMFGDEAKVTTYTYTNGLVTQIVINYLGTTRTETYTYNADGNVESMSAVTV